MFSVQHFGSFGSNQYDHDVIKIESACEVEGLSGTVLAAPKPFQINATHVG